MKEQVLCDCNSIYAFHAVPQSSPIARNTNIWDFCDSIWRHKSGSTSNLCLTAQAITWTNSWLLISELVWHLSESPIYYSVLRVRKLYFWNCYHISQGSNELKIVVLFHAMLIDNNEVTRYVVFNSTSKPIRTKTWHKGCKQGMGLHFIRQNVYISFVNIVYSLQIAHFTSSNTLRSAQSGTHLADNNTNTICKAMIELRRKVHWKKSIRISRECGFAPTMLHYTDCGDLFPWCLYVYV